MPGRPKNWLPWVTRHGGRGNQDTLQKVRRARGIYRQQGVVDSDMRYVSLSLSLYIYIHTLIAPACLRKIGDCIAYVSALSGILMTPTPQTLVKFRNVGQNEQLEKASTPQNETLLI